jgi:hypothetical protein
MDESYLLFWPSPAGDISKPQAVEEIRNKREIVAEQKNYMW